MMRNATIIFCISIPVFSCDPDSSPSASDTADTASERDTSAEIPPCERLFGAPSEQTGVDETLCRPFCECDGETFSPPEYTREDIDALASRELLNPPERLAGDPYETPDDYAGRPDAVCAVLLDTTDSNAYRLETYDDTSAAEAAGGIVTHHGACGLCSSLANLAVYLSYPDLTEPVRSCGVQGALQGEQTNMDCLLALGFEPACAQIWYYNTVNTRTACLDICTSMLADPYLTPQGELNACLACDEENSGDIFKAVAGRTRRNSGLPTAICRPCDTVAPVIHDYP